MFKDVCYDRKKMDYCNPLKIVFLPEMDKIEPGMFKGCSQLEQVVIHPKTKYIGWGAFEGCKKLKELILPEGLIVICNHAFENSGLEKIIFPEGLETIGRNAFMNTCLQEIVIPSSLENLGDGAFSGCKSLEKVTVPSDPSDDFLWKVGNIVFLNCSPNLVFDLGYNKDKDLELIEGFKNCLNFHEINCCITYQIDTQFGTREFLNDPENNQDSLGSCRTKITETSYLGTSIGIYEKKKEIISLEDIENFQIRFQTLGGDIYTLDKGWIKQDKTIEEMLLENYPEMTDSKDDFELLLHCDVEPCSNLKPIDLFKMSYDSNLQFDIQQYIMIVWK